MLALLGCLASAGVAPGQTPTQTPHAEMLHGNVVLPRDSSLNAAWQSLGPNQVASAAYGNVTGRVTSIAIDPADATGNTVYLGTTGGGVWKSINAAGSPASVIFTPLTDNLPVFSANAGNAATTSISIGAISVQSGVILAGTGDPNDSLDSYYGGGLLRSSDGGLTWTLIQGSHDGLTGNHPFLGMAFAGFAWSSLSANLVVAAISQAVESDLVNTPNAAYRVMGLYYSVDAGVTWQMATIEDGSQIVQRPESLTSGGSGNAVTAVVWNPIRQRFYAAVRYHGYYESSDGATWTRLARQPGALTLTACPTNPGLPGSTACPIFRGALAVQPQTGDTFALTVDSSNRDQGLWQDLCAVSGSSCTSGTVAFAKQLPSLPLEVGNGSKVIAQADYNLALTAVANGTDTLLFAGTTDLYRCSLAAGCVLRNTTNAVNGCAAPAMVGPAQHAIATLPGIGGAQLLYLGNDSGLWRSTDGVAQAGPPCSAADATHFQNLNGGLGSLAEVIRFDQDPADPATLLVGLGSNGTAGTSKAGLSTPWPQLATGEGGYVAIDQTSPANWYVSTAAGVSMRQCTAGSACTAAQFSGTPNVGPAQTAFDASALDAPWILDPALHTNVVVGTCRVYRGPATGGALWSTANSISKVLGGPANATCDANTNPVIRSLAAGGASSVTTAAQNSGSQILYAGLAGSRDGGGNYGGHLFMTKAGGTAGSTTAWTDLYTSPVTNGGGQNPFNPGGFDLSSVVVDPHDATGQTVYVTVMAFTGNGINTQQIYRSTDGGAHWTAIGSNLPGVPANSVVVDPNDANTLYIALDTGVYVTTQVSTCSTANCWTILGVGLPNSPVVQLAAAAQMPTGDGRTGVLRAATYGRGIWQIPLLTAISIARPALSITPASLTFTAQAVGTASGPQTITVTSTGNAPVTVSRVAMSGDFTETDNCTAAPIAMNASCTIQASFLPAATGSRSGLLTVYANVAGGQATVTLLGTAVPPAAIVLNPINLAFPSTSIGATSAGRNITVSNTGGVAAALQAPGITGDFSISVNTCGTSLAPGTGCTVSVTFSPVASGARSGTFTITDDAGTQTASLLGTGTAPATDTLTPLSLNFTAQQLTTASAAQQVILSNAGDVALTLIRGQISSGDFIVVNPCGNSLGAHSTCSMAVSFVPTMVGTGAGVLTVTDEFRSQTIQLAGIGVAPPGVSVSPTSTLNFGALAVGLTSPSQTVTLSNNGGLPLLIQSISATPASDFAIAAGSNTCATSVAPGAACTLQVVFTPYAGGPRAGALTITDNARNSPQVVQLLGAGVDFALNANGITSATIKAGQSAVFPLLLVSTANVAGVASFACTGVPVHATCTVTPGSVALGTTSTIAVTVATSVLGAAIEPPRASFHRGVWLAFGLPIGMLLLGRRRAMERSYAALFCMLACLLCGLGALAGCGSGRNIPDSGIGTGPGPGATPPTPSGTYGLIVTATSAGLSRSVSLVLVVE